jgi:hypothetical protein
MFLPQWKYGNSFGRLLVIDYGQSNWTVNQCGKNWTRLCTFVDILKHIWIANFVPENLFPGYYELCRVFPKVLFNDPAIGTTSYSSHIWNDPLNSPYSYTNEFFVEHMNYDPEYVAAMIVHEYFHCVMLPPNNQHSIRMGTIFTSPMAGVGISDHAISMLGTSIWCLNSGWRTMLNERVIIGHNVSADNPIQPGPYPGQGPPRNSEIRRISDNKLFDYSKWYRPLFI